MKQELKTIAIFILFTALFIAAHEQTHAEVFQAYDCTNIQYHVLQNDSFASVSADCTNPEVLQTQEMVEAVGYHAIPIQLLLTFLICLYTYNEDIL